jgi:hypothetical protein
MPLRGGIELPVTVRLALGTIQDMEPDPETIEPLRQRVEEAGSIGRRDVGEQDEGPFSRALGSHG